MVLLILIGNRPEIHELQMVKLSNGRILRIMESVAPQWKQMAIALGFSVVRIKSIEKSKQCQTDDASFEMFSCWLEGEHDLKPPTWDVLIQCLKQANLMDIVEMLNNLQIVSSSMNYKNQKSSMYNSTMSLFRERVMTSRWHTCTNKLKLQGMK